MSEHTIEREAVLWAWTALYGGPPEDYNVPDLVGQVLRGEDWMPAIKVAIAYVESAKNHLDTVLELETNLATVTAERDAYLAAFSNSHLDKLKQENAELAAELKELRFRMESLEK